MSTREDIVRIARSLIRTPYLHNGLTRKGIDCVGAIALVAKEAGLIPEDYKVPYHSHPPNPRLFEQELPKFLDEIAFEDAQDGDVVVLSEPNPKGTPRPRHMYILAHRRDYPDEQTIIGVDERIGNPIVTEHRFMDYHANRVWKAFKWKSL